jgi:hypothetical protein
MQGYLDPAYPARTPTDFRAVLDRLVVGLRPDSGYSYGAALLPVPPSLATLGNRGFYADRDTRLEAVLARVDADTGHTRTHIIVGDGRRGSPDAANGQFVRMRETAERWIRAGGTFLVGTTLAPFRTVPSDPSGCRADGPNAARQTCPLYAFAFVAPGADEQVPVALAEAFEHVYASPQRQAPPAAVELDAGSAVAGINVNRAWARSAGGIPIVRVGGPSAARRWTTLRLQPSASIAADGTTWAFLRGQAATLRVTARALRAGSAGTPWQPVGPAAPVRASPEGELSVDVTTHGATAPTGLYRVDVVPTGEPSWLATFDAADANDRLRTYGLGRLFEAWRQQARARSADDSAAIARLLFVIN